MLMVGYGEGNSRDNMNQMASEPSSTCASGLDSGLGASLSGVATVRPADPISTLSCACVAYRFSLHFDTVEEMLAGVGVLGIIDIACTEARPPHLHSRPHHHESHQPRTHSSRAKERSHAPRAVTWRYTRT